MIPETAAAIDAAADRCMAATIARIADAIDRNPDELNRIAACLSLRTPAEIIEICEVRLAALPNVRRFGGEVPKVNLLATIFWAERKLGSAA